MVRYRWWPVTLWIPVGLGGGACGSGTGVGGRPGDTLFIGVAASTAPTSEAYFHGVALAVARLNTQRPAGTPPFGLRRPPSGQLRQVEVAAALRDDPSVIGVVGHTGSAQTVEAAPVYADIEGNGRRAVVVVSPTATNPTVTRTNRWVFRVCPTDVDAVRALARFTVDSMRVRAATVIYRNDLFGRGYQREFRQTFEGLGGRVVDRFPYLASVVDHDAYAAVMAMNGSDAIVFAGGSPDAVQLVRSLATIGLTVPLLGSDDLSGLVGREEARGIRYTAFYAANPGGSEVAAGFYRAYLERVGEVPDHRAALAFDAAMVIGVAAASVGPDRGRIRDAVAEVGHGRDAVVGVTGRIVFDEWGDVVDKPVYVVEIRE